MTIYATYFDNNFLVRGLACLQSLIEHSATPPRILVLALDAACAEGLARLWPSIGRGSELEILTLASLESAHPSLRAAKSNRTPIEYYFTLTPFLCAEALVRAGEGEHSIYIDADLFFYAEPEIAVRAVGDAAVAVVEHRFPRSLERLADLYGRFNVGWIAFKPSHEARACIAKWQAQCIEWCGDRPEQGRFADQKYLDAWPRQIKSLKVVDHPGVDLAPWNVARHHLTRAENGGVKVDDAVLIFFHFHRLERLGFSLYETDFRIFGSVDHLLCSQVYSPYLVSLDRIESQVRDSSGWQPAARLARYVRPGRSRLVKLVLWPRRALRLFLRRRIIFLHGRVLPPWRSLPYA